MYFKVTLKCSGLGDESIKEKKATIDVKTREFNEMNEETRVFVSTLDAKRPSLLVDISFKREKETADIAAKYLEYVGLGTFSVSSVEEITGSTFYSSMEKSERPGGLRRRGSLNGQKFLPADDYLIKEEAEDKSIESASSSLSKEIERINTSIISSFYGHPVHYIFLMDSDSVIEYSLSALLSALHKKGRLISRRVVTLFRKKNEIDDDISSIFMRPKIDPYESNKGGTVVIYPPRFEDDEADVLSPALSMERLISMLSSSPKDVLSVVVLARKRIDDADNIIAKLRGKVNFVVIREDVPGPDAVTAFLRKKALEDGIDEYADSLISKYIESESSLSYDELEDFYDKWYRKALIENIYPEYKECRINETESAGKGKAYQKLESLVGLGKVKALIEEAVALNKYNKMLLSENKNPIKVSRHMVFTGNPGTAKTTVARLFATIMKEEGILPVGNLVEVGRKDLVGKYVGWTAKNVERAFEKAKGSVLFIDEAYSLSDERSLSFGDEAINTIVQLMENYRESTIVIFAGYPERMENFLDRNPGLRSRISYHINFDDYSSDELYSILLLMSAEDDVEIADDAKSRVMEIIEEGKKGRDYGNGRFIRNLYDKARIKAVMRTMKSGALSSLSLRAEDFDFSVISESVKRREIGFSFI